MSRITETLNNNLNTLPIPEISDDYEINEVDEIINMSLNNPPIIKFINNWFIYKSEMNKPKNERNSELANSKRILANYHIRKLNLTLNIKEITYDTLKTVFERININAPYNNISDSDDIKAQTKQHLNDNSHHGGGWINQND